MRVIPGAEIVVDNSYLFILNIVKVAYPQLDKNFH